MNFFAANLKTLRIEYGYTQEKISSILNVKRSRYGAWEEGRAEPDFETMLKVADFFHRSPKELVSKDFKVNEDKAKIEPFNSIIERYLSAPDNVRKAINHLLNIHP